MLILNYNSITHTKAPVSNSRYTGSAKYYHDGKNLIEKKHQKSHKEVEGNIAKRYAQIAKYCHILGINIDPNTIENMHPGFKGYPKIINQYREFRKTFDEKKPNKNRKYRLNKKLVRKRAISLSRLKKSKKTLAFFSISFPAKSEDQPLYEIWNRWLTSCRRHHGLKTYIWIAERQKNGTLHFHLLTNDYLKIQKVNKSMASAIRTSVHQGKLTWGQSSYRMYNGVDVENIYHPKRRPNENRYSHRARTRQAQKANKSDRAKFVIKYLTKYITKENNTFANQPWHCSRDISRLFTGQIIPYEENYLQKLQLSDDTSDYIIYYEEIYTIYVFKNDPNANLHNEIDKINEKIYHLYHQRGDPQKKSQKDESSKN